MKCEQCGTENLEGSSFCKNCGKAFKEKTTNIKPQEIAYKIDIAEQKANQKNSNETEENKLENNNNTTNEEQKITSNYTVYCKCGQKIEADWQTCPKCNEPINVKIINAEKEPNDVSQNPFIYILLSIISFTVLGMLGQIGFGYMLSFAIIITGKINCPKSIIIKILYYLMLIYFIMMIVGLIWLFIICGQIKSCPG